MRGSDVEKEAGLAASRRHRKINNTPMDLTLLCLLMFLFSI